MSNVHSEKFNQHIRWEIPVQLCISDFLNEGDIAFDIGANIGALSVAMSRIVGPNGKIFAFEANPLLIEPLKKTLDMNEVRNTTVIEKAVTEESLNKVPFYCNEKSYNMASSSLIFHEGWKKILVNTVTIDDFCKMLGKFPSLVKLDVEGKEYQALLGAEKTLETKPVLVFEYVAKKRNELSEFDILDNHEYTMFDTNLYCKVSKEFYLENNRGSVVSNILAIPPNKFKNSFYPKIEIEPVLDIDIEKEKSNSNWIELKPGRYIVKFDFDGPFTQTVGLKTSTKEDEYFTYVEAPLNQLRHHSCSNCVFELNSPNEVKFEISNNEEKLVQFKKINILKINDVRK